MGKMLYLMTSMVAINLALLLFTCNSWDSSGSCVPESSIWTFVTNPQSLNSANFWDTLFGSASGIAAIAASIIIVGSFFMKVEFPLYASISLALLPGMYAWVKLYQLVRASSLFMNTQNAAIVAVIATSPIILAYVFTVLDWARGRD